jgi:hypothetical protein
VTERPASLVDSNVFFDVVTNDPHWAAWSIRQLEAAALRGPLAINEVIYAEISIRYSTIEALDSAVEGARLRIEPMSRAVLFVAGKAFQRFRANGGRRTSVLPDFFIGAHASVLGIPLLTRDARRYRTYFPSLQLISPIA